MIGFCLLDFHSAPTKVRVVLLLCVQPIEPQLGCLNCFQIRGTADDLLCRIKMAVNNRSQCKRTEKPLSYPHRDPNLVLPIQDHCRTNVQGKCSICECKLHCFTERGKQAVLALRSSTAAGRLVETL